MKGDCDLLILGGGCAGLSLARELAAFGLRCPSTRILEQRAQYQNDRTWCFWGDDAALMTHLVDHQWPRVVLRTATDATRFDCAKHPYQMISSNRFYDDALHTIAAAPQLALEQGVRILAEPNLVGGVWQVETNAGLRRGKILIDTRGAAAAGLPHQAPILWQSFFGHEVSCEAPVFDPTSVTLMDFIDDPAGRVVFTYLLPLSAHRALVELTVFGPSPLTPADLALPLQQQIRARVGSHAVVVERSEHGILPMGLPAQPSTVRPNHVRVGLMHGAARASTGYAFQRIQRWARDCGARLAAGAAPIGHAADPVLLRSMDRLFLSVLRHRPASAAALFINMFARSDGDTLVRFLSDRASLRDYLGIVAALPALPFVQQLGRNLMRAS